MFLLSHSPVAVVLRVLDESTPTHEIHELIASNKVISGSVGFTRSRFTRRVYIGQYRGESATCSPWTVGCTEPTNATRRIGRRQDTPQRAS